MFCCGWRSIWCVLDTLAHLVPSDLFHHSRLVWWICEKHNAGITR